MPQEQDPLAALARLIGQDDPFKAPLPADDKKAEVSKLEHLLEELEDLDRKRRTQAVLDKVLGRNYP